MLVKVFIIIQWIGLKFPQKGTEIIYLKDEVDNYKIQQSQSSFTKIVKDYQFPKSQNVFVKAVMYTSIFPSFIFTIFYFRRMSSSVDKLKQQYVKDAELMASKSRFGYFSLLPSHTAAVTDNSAPQPHRDPDGKVHTEPRNIYSGATASGMTKKSYFSYTPSAFHGSAYQDPSKPELQSKLQESKKWSEKQVYKPACLNQTLVKAPYEYISETDPLKKKKTLRDSSGKVITQSANMLISLPSKIDYQKNKQFKYMECPPQEKKKEEQKEGEKGEKEQPFKAGHPKKELFTSNSQAYFDINIKKSSSRKQVNLSLSHEAPFKPSCISKGEDFTPIVYKEEGTGKEQVKPIKKQNKQQQPFKLSKVDHNSKPTPSISLSKTNLLRGCR